MDKFEPGQLVKKIKHPTWIAEEQQSLVPIGSVGTVMHPDVDCKAHPGERGVWIMFSFGPYVCQHGTVVPFGDEDEKISQESRNKVISWDQCSWRPRDDVIEKLNLDFTKEKKV
jgi:hypothetical protein